VYFGRRVRKGEAIPGKVDRAFHIPLMSRLMPRHEWAARAGWVDGAWRS
jgi:hypothetical protein